jgi:hypothetical protein
MVTATLLVAVTSMIRSEYPPAPPASPCPLPPPPPPTSFTLINLTPLGLFHVELPVNTCIPLKLTALYSRALFDELVISTVLAAPTVVRPVPPLETGAVPVVTLVAKLTEPLASLPDVTARFVMSPVGIVLLAMLALPRLLLTIAAPVKFFNV